MTIRYAYSQPSIPAAEAVSGDLLRLLADHSPDVTLLAQPDARCRYATPASALVLGRTPAEMAGLDLRELAIEPDREALEDVFVRLNSGEAAVSAEFRVQQAGQLAWIEVIGRRLPGATGAVLCLRDISARKQGQAVMEEANSLLRHRAATDTVTGLLNRDHLVATLEREVRRAQRDHTQLAVLVLGLAEFRGFTDQYGWEAADGALRAVADCIGASLHRPADCAGRLASDEFAIVLPSTHADGAETIARRLLAAVDALAIPHAGATTGQLQAASGSALCAPGMDGLSLLREAHCAMRTACGRST